MPHYLQCEGIAKEITGNANMYDIELLFLEDSPRSLKVHYSWMTRALSVTTVHRNVHLATPPLSQHIFALSEK